MKIVYFDLDTLRPDHLGCYGYHRNTSPHIDRIASEGIRFNNYYASDAPCLPSRTAMMSGRFGIHTGVVNHSGTAADMRAQGAERGFRDELGSNSLPAFLNKDLGLHTCFIGGFGARHSSWTFYAGFREIHDTGKGGMESAEEVTPYVLDWIEQNRDREDWYLHINYWDPHTPYRTPEEFGNPFEDDPLPVWFDQRLIDEHMKMGGPHTIQDISMYDDAVSGAFPRQPGHVTDMKEMRDLIDGYDCGIRYMDNHIGKVLEAFEKGGIRDELIIIVSSDHGENFGELGMYAEHGTSDNICHRIPMIIRWPGRTVAGSVDDGLHYNLDLLPTLAELNGKLSRASWEGSSYAPSVTEGKDTGRSELVLGQFAHGCQRSVRWDRWIYLRTWHDGYHRFEEEMLFDLDEDPHEQHNQARQLPEVVQIARGKYEAWHSRMMGSMPYADKKDPMDYVMEELPRHCHYDLEKYSRRLVETGREEEAERLRREFPEQFP